MKEMKPLPPLISKTECPNQQRDSETQSHQPPLAPAGSGSALVLRS